MSNITAYGWEDQGSKHVCTTGDEDHITLFSQGQSDWNTPPPDDVTYDFAQQTPPKGVGMTVGTSRVGYAWPGQGWQQIAYVSSDGHICEIASPATGGWGFADLSGNGPVSAGKNIAAFAWNSVGTKQVVYVGQNGHIHELSVGPHGKWGSADLTARAKSSGLVSFVSAPSADLGMIAAFAWDQSHQKTVVFRTPDGHI